MNGSNKAISVALCTYNGAKFLEEQLWSIEGQTLRPLELVVCDDQSTDDTIDILEKFKRKSAFQVKIIKNNNRLGIVKNFAKAISLCSANYIALCDQDDLWQPNKLLISSKTMENAELHYGEESLLLVHSDLMVANAQGQVIASSMMKQKKIRFVEKDPLKNLLVQNFVTGCSVLINRPMINAALPIPEKALMHDWWLALIAAALGNIILIPEPTVIYRQHLQNVVGSNSLFSLHNMKRIANIKSLERNLSATIEQGLVLRQRLLENQGFNVPIYVKEFLDTAQNNGIKAAFVALRHNIRKYPSMGNFVFLLLLLKSGYLRYL